MILGALATVALLAGCMSNSVPTQSLAMSSAATHDQPSETARPPAPQQDLRATTDEPRHSAATEPSAAESAAPPVQIATPAPVDPGAALLAKAIASHLPAPPSGRDRVVSLGAMRNFSRASETEFHDMQTRLAAVLTDAGRQHQLRFTADGAAPADYQMSGACYLVVRSGFDFWELFPAINRDDLSPALWTAPIPVLFLRTDRSGQQQVFFEALGGNAP